MTDDIEMREAQLVYVELETRWNDERERNPKLMRELGRAEDRLIKLFMNGWAPRPVMPRAWSDYRLMRSCGRRNRADNRRCGVPSVSEDF